MSKTRKFSMQLTPTAPLGGISPHTRKGSIPRAGIANNDFTNLSVNSSNSSCFDSQPASAMAYTGLTPIYEIDELRKKQKTPKSSQIQDRLTSSPRQRRHSVIQRTSGFGHVSPEVQRKKTDDFSEKEKESPGYGIHSISVDNRLEEFSALNQFAKLQSFISKNQEADIFENILSPTPIILERRKTMERKPTLESQASLKATEAAEKRREDLPVKQLSLVPELDELDISNIRRTDSLRRVSVMSGDQAGNIHRDHFLFEQVSKKNGNNAHTGGRRCCWCWRRGRGRGILSGRSGRVGELETIRETDEGRVYTSQALITPKVKSKKNRWAGLTHEYKSIAIRKLFQRAITKVIEQQRENKAGRKLRKTLTTIGNFHNLACLIMPDSPFSFIWSLVMLTLLLYTSIVTPFVVAFVPYPPFTFTIWELFIDALFFSDIIINFFTPYYENGLLVTSKLKIAKRYLKSWFILDLVACIPFHFFGSTEESGRYKNLLRLLRVSRISRLMRLFRLFKIAKMKKLGGIIDTRLEFAFKIHPGIGRMMKAFVSLLFLIHLFSCFLFMTANFSNFSPETWVVRYEIMDSTIWEQYLLSLYWVIQTLTTVGYGDLSPKTNLERFTCVVFMIVGVGFYSFAVGNVTSIVYKLDNRERKLQAQLATLLEFGKKAGLPKELVGKIKNYLEHKFRNLMGSFNQEALLSELPCTLRAEVVTYTHRSLLQKVHFFNGKNPEFLWEILPKLKPLLLKEGDFLYRAGDYAEEVYFVVEGGIDLICTEGFVLKNVNSGSYFGEVELIQNIPREHSACIAEETELLLIQKKDFLRILHKFPNVKHEILSVAKYRSVNNRKLIETAKSSNLIIPDKHRGSLNDSKFMNLFNEAFSKKVILDSRRDSVASIEVSRRKSVAIGSSGRSSRFFQFGSFDDGQKSKKPKLKKVKTATNDEIASLVSEDLGSPKKYRKEDLTPSISSEDEKSYTNSSVNGKYKEEEIVFSSESLESIPFSESSNEAEAQKRIAERRKKKRRSMQRKSTLKIRPADRSKRELKGKLRKEKTAPMERVDPFTPKIMFYPNLPPNREVRKFSLATPKVQGISFATNLDFPSDSSLSDVEVGELGVLGDNNSNRKKSSSNTVVSLGDNNSNRKKSSSNTVVSSESQSWRGGSHGYSGGYNHGYNQYTQYNEYNEEHSGYRRAKPPPIRIPHSNMSHFQGGCHSPPHSAQSAQTPHVVIGDVGGEIRRSGSIPTYILEESKAGDGGKPPGDMVGDMGSNIKLSREDPTPLSAPRKLSVPQPSITLSSEGVSPKHVTFQTTSNKIHTQPNNPSTDKPLNPYERSDTPNSNSSNNPSNLSAASIASSINRNINADIQNRGGAIPTINRTTSTTNTPTNLLKHALINRMKDNVGRMQRAASVGSIELGLVKQHLETTSYLQAPQTPTCKLPSPYIQ